MSDIKRGRVGLVVERDDAERLSADDMATQREAEFLEAALRAHGRAARPKASMPGVCCNCGEPCLALAVYCDLDCREDHEARERQRARMGGGG